jgi:hypothetical protein
VLLLLLFATESRAQIDWGDLFPDGSVSGTGQQEPVAAPPSEPAAPALKENAPQPARAAQPERPKQTRAVQPEPVVKPVAAKPPIAHQIRGAATRWVVPSARVETGVNVRQGPSMDSPIVGTLRIGDRAVLAGLVSNWFQVTLRDGTRGYVSRDWTIPVAVRATAMQRPGSQPPVAIASAADSLSDAKGPIAPLSPEQAEPVRFEPQPPAAPPAPDSPVQSARLAVRPPPAAEARPVEAPRAPQAAPGSTGGYGLARFGLKEGDVISDDNRARFAELLTPGLEWGIHQGWRLRVTEPRTIHLPRRYREATEMYSGQVAFGPGGVSLLNYVAGLPFSNIDANDPSAAMKIMWNYYYNFVVTDDIDLRLFDADTGSVGKHEGIRVERHYIVDHYRRLTYNGRLYVDPKPELPNPEGYRLKESLHPLLEPFDLKGVGGTFYRYLDPSRQDDTWIYLPQLRRVRRLSTAQRSDALFGQDTDVDSYWGYNGHIAWLNYRLLGERVVLGVVHAQNVPAKWQEPENWLFDDVWEPRRVWVIEAVSKFPQYAYGKRVIYVDKEGWIVPLSDIYDRAGQLWKLWVNLYSVKKKATPTARISVYEDEFVFPHGLVMLDTQLSHATKVSIPSTKSVGEEGIFINMGERSGTSEEYFTIAHLIETGH